MTTAENVAALNRAIKDSTPSAAEATVGLRTFGTFMSGGNPCHHCGVPATAQWQRHATGDEAEQHWAATEQNIRANNDGHAAVEYVADRSDSVTKAVFGCDEHPDPAPGVTHDADCGGHGACGCGGADRV